MNKKQNLKEHERSAGVLAVWGLLAVLAWFFHLVGFLIILVFVGLSLKDFLIKYEVYKIVEGTPDAGYEQLAIPGIQPESDQGSGASLGADGQRRLRENLSESEEQRHSGDVG